MSTFTRSQQQTLAIIPKCMATVSVPCSLWLIYEIYYDHRTVRTNAIQRALLGMSLIDIMSSAGWFLSSWAVPRGTFAYAAGNQSSCSFQGVLLQLAIGAPLYNSSLALFYLLMVKYNWTDDMLAKIEIWVHAIILSFSIGTSLILLPLKQYNSIGHVCWIIGDPVECGDSTHISNPNVPCERGSQAYLYGVLLFYGPLWVCVVACIISMAIVYHKVRKTMFRVSSRFGFSTASAPRTQTNRSKTEEVALQSILFTLSFIITWMPSTLWSLAHWFRFGAFWLDLLSAICEPLQGFWNFLIFIRTRKKTKGKIRNLLATVFPCWIAAADTTNHVSRSHSYDRGTLQSTNGPTRQRSARSGEHDYTSGDDTLNPDIMAEPPSNYVRAISFLDEQQTMAAAAESTLEMTMEERAYGQLSSCEPDTIQKLSGNDFGQGAEDQANNKTTTELQEATPEENVGEEVDLNQNGSDYNC